MFDKFESYFPLGELQKISYDPYQQNRITYIVILMCFIRFQTPKV
jgi:hypothetical protein